MPDLNSLIVFAHVVEANGFSKAARRLKMPTSTVSRRIADLEKQLGVRLIERHSFAEGFQTERLDRRWSGLDRPARGGLWVQDAPFCAPPVARTEGTRRTGCLCGRESSSSSLLKVWNHRQDDLNSQLSWCTLLFRQQTQS